MATNDTDLEKVVDDMCARLERAWGKRTDDAPELERQIAACFLYGMISAHTFERKLSPENMVSAVTYMLMTRLGYAEREAEQFLETFLGASGTVASMIGSGISGYYAYAAGRYDDLAAAFTQLLSTVYLKA